VPDMRGRVAIGTGQGVDLTLRAANDSGGTETVTLTPSQMPVHQHANVISYTMVAQGELPVPVSVLIPNWSPLAVNLQSYSAGGGAAHQNMPPYRAVSWLIVC